MSSRTRAIASFRSCGVSSRGPVMPSNVSRHLREAARRHPSKPAVCLPSGKAISFAQLDAECDRFARLFEEKGVRAGMRVVLLVKPGFAFVPTIFGCFRLVAIPACIDPGMKLKSILSCVREAAPEAVIGGHRALALTRHFRRTFSSVRVRVVVPRVVPRVGPGASRS